MVVDDAVVVRGLVTRWIEEAPGLQLVGRAAQRPRGGRSARRDRSRRRGARRRDAGTRRHLRRCRCCCEKKRDLVVIMASALTRRQRRGQLEGARARRGRLHPQAGRPKAASSTSADVPARADREDPRARRCVAGAAPVAAAVRAGRRRPATRRLAGAVQRTATWRMPRDAESRPIKLRPFSAGDAARAADRRFDRRAAGADPAGAAARCRRRPRAGADHPAHAGDLHHHSRRASGARQRQAGARSRGRRAGAGRARSISRPAASTCGSRAATAPR